MVNNIEHNIIINYFFTLYRVIATNCNVVQIHLKGPNGWWHFFYRFNVIKNVT